MFTQPSQAFGALRSCCVLLKNQKRLGQLPGKAPIFKHIVLSWQRTPTSYLGSCNASRTLQVSQAYEIGADGLHDRVSSLSRELASHNNMVYEVQRASPDDALALTRIGHAAMEHDTRTRKAIHYDDATPGQREEYWTWRSSRLKARIEQKGAHCFKAIDIETGKIVGFSVILEPRPAEEQARNQQREQDLKTPEIIDISAFAQNEKLLSEARRQSLGDRTDFWYIMSMCIHPDYQRQGIGQALLRADLSLADAAKSDTYLESRPIAVKLYLSQGFEQIGVLPVLEDGEIHPVMLRKARV